MGLWAEGQLMWQDGEQQASSLSNSLYWQMMLPIPSPFFLQHPHPHGFWKRQALGLPFPPNPGSPTLLCTDDDSLTG